MKIVFLDRYSIGDADITPLLALGELICYDNTTDDELIDRCVGASVVITNKVKISAEQIDRLSDLKLICIAATGTDNVAVDYARARAIAVRNVAGYSTESVAEATLASALALLRHTVFYDRYVKSGEYAHSDRGFNLDRSISQISSKRWGIIGLGNIGRRVAQLAECFGAKVCYCSLSGSRRQEQYDRAELSELLSLSDIVSIHSPLNDTSRGLITYDELSMMKPGAILVNMGRGGIVLEQDLARALNEGIIAGAALDVFDREPIDSANPLLGVSDPDRLILAPHCGWSSSEAREVLIASIAKHISDFVS